MFSAIPVCVIDRERLISGFGPILLKIAGHLTRLSHLRHWSSSLLLVQQVPLRVRLDRGSAPSTYSTGENRDARSLWDGEALRRYMMRVGYSGQTLTIMYKGWDSAESDLVDSSRVVSLP